MSKNPGKQFEKDFVSSIPDRCDFTRLKDAGGWNRSAEMRFTIKNPCDCIIFSDVVVGHTNAHMYKIELKSLLGKSLPFGNIKPKALAMMKFLSDLCASEEKGVIACFIVNFRSVNLTYKVSASDIKRFIENTDRKSIPIAWFQEHGTLIKQTLKKVHYRYDLEWL